MAADYYGPHLSRRRFVGGAGLAALGLLAGCALPFSATPSTAKTHRIAYFSAGPLNPENEFRVAAFRQAMNELGYVEGQNLLIEQYNANDTEFAGPAAELVRRQPDVILVPSTILVRALQAATSTIPIVSAGSGELVERGLAVSHAHPGGNVTGLSTPNLAGKHLQLLQEAVPTLSRVIILFDTLNAGFERQPYEAAARTLGLQVQFLDTNVRADLESAVETAIRQHADGLYVPLGPAISRNQTRLAELALQSGLPSIWAQSEAAGRGGLMAYGPNRTDRFRRAAYYVDRILKGAKPADLPIEQPTTFTFVINLKTAQALGLTIPPHVLFQATEVIQ
jgi:putative tryptophan/tyrosine transport system substrate-binding protein